MKIQLKNIQQKNIIIFDIEYDQNLLVQIALLILCESRPDIFEVQKSLNIYINPGHLLNNFFVKYTNITNDFLCDNGVDLAVARTLVDFALFDIDLNNTLLVSHGINSDFKILTDNDIKLKEITKHYCTYNMAKKLLPNLNGYSLKEVAKASCYQMFNEHNAYADVWGTLYAFCYLNGLEND